MVWGMFDCCYCVFDCVVVVGGGEYVDCIIFGIDYDVVCVGFDGCFGDGFFIGVGSEVEYVYVFEYEGY